MPARAKQSIKANLLIQQSILLALLLGLAFAILWNRAYRAINVAYEQELRGIANALSALLYYHQETERLCLNFDVKAFPKFAQGRDDGFFQIRDAASGDLIFRSPSLGNHTFEELSRNLRTRPFKDGEIWGDLFPGQKCYGLHPEDFRCIAISVPAKQYNQPGAGSRDEEMMLMHALKSSRTFSRPPDIELIVLIESDDAYRRLEQLTGYMGGLFLLVFVLIIGGTNWIMNRSFRSLSRLLQRLESIDPLHPQRIEHASQEKETQVVGEAINALLLRLEKSLTWEREMTANMAHELRTPVSAIRNMMEVTLSRERDIQAYQEALGDGLSAACQMQNIVENILELARIEAGQSVVHVESFDLRSLVEECWLTLKERAASQKINLALNVESRIRVCSDRAKLGIILSNLLENAVCYTDAGGRINIEAAENPDKTGITFCLSNSGDPLSEQEIEDIFQPFHRMDKARSDSTHCGLGLSLVASLCALLKINLQARSEPGLSLAVELSLPCD